MIIEWKEHKVYDDLVMWEAYPTEQYTLYVEDSPYYGVYWAIYNNYISKVRAFKQGGATTVSVAKHLVEEEYPGLFMGNSKQF